MLRSQDGVEEVENPYVNLKKGLIKITARKNKPIDLARIVKLLEEEMGFEPVTEVALELRGRPVRRDGKLFFEVNESGQVFAISGDGPAEPLLTEGRLVTGVATVVDPQSPDRLVFREAKAEE